MKAHVAIAGQVKWRLEFRHVASPVARLLLPDAGGKAGVFALFGKVGRSPRVYASRDRDALLKQLQAAAYKKMGLTLAGAWSTSLACAACHSILLLSSVICTVAACHFSVVTPCCTVAACHPDLQWASCACTVAACHSTLAFCHCSLLQMEHLLGFLKTCLLQGRAPTHPAHHPPPACNILAVHACALLLQSTPKRSCVQRSCWKL